METRDLNFNTNVYDPYAVVANIGEINKLVHELQPAIEQCLDGREAIDPSKKGEFADIRKWLSIFTDPSSSDIYSVTLKVVKNFDQISEASTAAIKEYQQGRCARAGYIFGKLIRKIMQDDASLTDVLGVGAE